MTSRITLTATIDHSAFYALVKAAKAAGATDLEYQVVATIPPVRNELGPAAGSPNAHSPTPVCGDAHVATQTAVEGLSPQPAEGG